MSLKERGSASMDGKKRREIASKGGKAAHALGIAHRWDAGRSEAGRKEGWRGQRETAEYGAHREGRKLRPLRETQAAGLHTTTRFSRRSDFVGSFCTNGHAERKAGL